MPDQVNVPLLRKAVEWAETEAAKPGRTGQWYQPLTVVPAVEREGEGIGSAECGTAYCIAGYIALLGTGKENPYDSPDLTDCSICDYAADQIGGDRDQAADLFASNNTIADVRRIAEDIAGERL